MSQIQPETKKFQRKTEEFKRTFSKTDQRAAEKRCSKYAGSSKRFEKICEWLKESDLKH